MALLPYWPAAVPRHTHSRQEQLTKAAALRLWAVWTHNTDVGSGQRPAPAQRPAASGQHSPGHGVHDSAPAKEYVPMGQGLPFGDSELSLQLYPATQLAEFTYGHNSTVERSQTH